MTRCGICRPKKQNMEYKKYHNLNDNVSKLTLVTTLLELFGKTKCFYVINVIIK